MTPQEVRALLISLRAIRKCWGCRQRKPIQQFNIGQGYCGECRDKAADCSAHRRRLQRKYGRAA